MFIVEFLISAGIRADDIILRDQTSFSINVKDVLMEESHEDESEDSSRASSAGGAQTFGSVREEERFHRSGPGLSEETGDIEAPTETGAD